MTVESDIKRAEVVKKSNECDILILNADKESKEVAIKQKVIDVDKVRIAAETVVTLAIEDQANKELQKAMPALESANDAVSKLKKEHISEVKSMNNPPKDVATVMAAVMTFLRKGKDWVSVKKELNDPKFA